MHNKNIQTEIDASFLYKKLAENESSEVIKKVFLEMSEIEMSHARAFTKKQSLKELPPPSRRAKIINFIGKTLGYDIVLSHLMETEKSISNVIVNKKKQQNIEPSSTDTNHVEILQNILRSPQNMGKHDISRFEKRHRSVGGNAIRAAVLGGNDGLVSNFSLVMGVVGATASTGANENETVLLTGMAGLLAGALSMALGEWISVKSSQELYENQMQLEMDELENNPEGEEKELKLIYMTQGFPEEEAKKMAADLIKDKSKAHEVLVKEELGISPEELKGSAVEAAVYSFIFFALGAIIPVVPFIWGVGKQAMYTSIICSSLGLFFIGASITLFTGKNVWYSGFRQVLFGLLAALITFGIGKWIGVEVAG